MIDLHVHTTHSDGQYSPDEVIKLAADAGIKTMAITDHDSVGAVQKGAVLAAEYGIDFISGIELSVRGSNDFHVLGYDLDCTNEALLRECERFTSERIKRLERVLDYLHENGV